MTVDKEFICKWDMLTDLKSEVSKALELCRREKVIGHSLDARVRLVFPENFRSVLGNEYSGLKFIFIVLLTIYHFYLGTCLEKLKNGQNIKSSKFFRIINEIPTLLLILIIFIVIFKPI